MTMSTPTYQIDDEVYLVASAKKGFLEAYRISAIRSISKGAYVYQINIRPKQPNEATVGDSVDLKSNRALFFSESELTDFCSAVELQITNLGSQLAKAQSLQATKC